MIPRNMAAVIAFAALTIVTGPVSAWNNTGHQTVGLLAYQALDPATKKKIQEILKDHPHYDEFLTKVPASVNQLEGIAMNAAIWPDWVRSNHKQFHRGTWHYINKPLIMVDAGDTKTRNQIEAGFSNPSRNHGDILRIIPESQKMVKAPADTMEEKQDRAIRLCWLFHLVGDLHQPLHAVALCNKQLLGGDRGGNMLWVTKKGHHAPTPLHTAWDHVLGDHGDVAGLARDIQMSIKVADADRKVTDPDKWADESVNLAKTKVYFFNDKLIDFVIDADSHGPSTAPKLPDGYEDQAAEIARQRIALAGARLADLLTATLP